MLISSLARIAAEFGKTFLRQLILLLQRQLQDPKHNSTQKKRAVFLQRSIYLV